MRVIRFNFNIFLFICNEYKAYLENSKIKYGKYNPYSVSTPLSASVVLDISFIESFLNGGIYYYNIDKLCNDKDLYDVLSRLTSYFFTNVFKYNSSISPIPEFNTTLAIPNISPSTVYFFKKGFSLYNHLHNIHPIIVSYRSLLCFKYGAGFLIFFLVCYILNIIWELVSCLFDICINKLKAYFKSCVNNTGSSSNNAESSSSNAQGSNNTNQVTSYGGLTFRTVCLGLNGNDGDDPDDKKKKKLTPSHYLYPDEGEIFYDKFKALNIGAPEIERILYELRRLLLDFNHLNPEGSHY